MSKCRGWVVVVACAIVGLAHAQDATPQVRDWHNARHRSCAFDRVIGKSPLPAEEDQASVEKWVVQACRGARYDYRVVRPAKGGVIVTDLQETSIAEVPDTRGEAQVSADARRDGPAVSVDAVETQMLAYIAQARATWPTAKARYIAGMPTGQILFVTMRLYEGARYEQVFVRVDGIEGGTVRGRIASTVETMSSYRRGDPIELPEGDVLDWTIAHPDGTEEGNVVGKFLDTVKTGQ